MYIIVYRAGLVNVIITLYLTIKRLKFVNVIITESDNQK